MKLNSDAKEETIKMFNNRLKNAEQSLKMHGITDYEVKTGVIIIHRDNRQYQYSITKRTWVKTETTKGKGIDNMIKELS